MKALLFLIALAVLAGVLFLWLGSSPAPGQAAPAANPPVATPGQPSQPNQVQANRAPQPAAAPTPASAPAAATAGASSGMPAVGHAVGFVEAVANTDGAPAAMAMKQRMTDKVENLQGRTTGSTKRASR